MLVWVAVDVNVRVWTVSDDNSETEYLWWTRRTDLTLLVCVLRCAGSESVGTIGTAD